MSICDELQARYRSPIGCDSGRYGIISRKPDPQSDLSMELARSLREDREFQKEMDKVLLKEINSGIAELGGPERS